MGISGMSNWSEYGDVDETYFYNRLQITQLRLQRTEELLILVLKEAKMSDDLRIAIEEYFNPRKK